MYALNNRAAKHVKDKKKATEWRNKSTSITLKLGV
jgi:hypothetical protein